MKGVIFKTIVATSQSGAMEIDTISKTCLGFMNRKIFSLILMTALFAVTATDAFSQVKGKIRSGIDVGVGRFFPITEGKSDLQMLGDINLGYNLNKNMNVGFKVGVTPRMRSHYDTLRHKTINFTSTYTLYFGSRTNPVVPFVGSGLGLYVMQISSPSLVVGNQVYRFGGFISTGLEFGKFRLSAKYDLLPATYFNTERFNSRSLTI